MKLNEAKDIIIKSMMCENLVGLCTFECEKCVLDVDAARYNEAYEIVAKHYIKNKKKVKTNENGGET